ncbi:MAG: DUF2142 domain-containing protein [Clostridia bacterium]
MIFKKKNIRNFAILISVIFIINIAGLFYLNNTRFNEYPINNSTDGSFVSFSQGNEITQNFTFSKNILKLSFQVSTFGKTDCSGDFKVELFDAKTNELIKKSEQKISNIQDKSYITFNFDKEPTTKGKAIKARISALSTSENAVALNKNNAHSDEMFLTINNENKANSLIFKATSLSCLSNMKVLFQLDFLLCILIVIFILFYKFNIFKSFKNKFLLLFTSIKNNKIKICKVMAMVLAVVLLAFLTEFIYENISYSKMENKGEVSEFNLAELKNADFDLDANGSLVSNKDNAKIPLKGGFIKALRVQLENEKYMPLIAQNSKKSINTENTRGDIYHWNYNKDLYKFSYNLADKADNCSIIAPNKGTIITSIQLDNTKQFNVFRVIFYVGVGLILLAVILILKARKFKIEVLFLVISLVLGGILATCLQPTVYSTYDEQIHYRMAITDFSYNRNSITKTDVAQYNMRLANVYDLKELKASNALNNANAGEIVDDVNVIKSTGIIPSYNRIGHLPTSIMIFVGKLFKMPYNIIFILGRLINVLIYSFLIYFGMKKLKSGKIILAVVALFPMAILYSATINYDWWVNGFLMFAVAYFIGELQDKDKPITLNNAIIMLGAFLVGLGPKAIYFPLILLLLLFKKEKFKNIKQLNWFRIATIACSVLVLISFLLPFVFSGAGGGDVRGGVGVDSMAQVKFILTNPLQYAGILFNFIKDYISLENGIGVVVGFGYVGFLKCYLPYLCLVVIAMFTDRSELDKNVCKIQNKIWFLIIYLFTVVLVCTSLYVSFTVVGSSTIAGVSARYLLPLVYPLVAIMGPFRIKNSINPKLYGTAMLALPAIFTLSGIWTNLISLYF